MNQAEEGQTERVQNAIEISLRLLVVGVLIYWSFRILQPFINVMVWGAVLAVAIYPLLGRLTAALGGRGKLALGLIVALALAAVIVPTSLISGSLLRSAQHVVTGLEDGSLTVPPPPKRIASLPLVGERVDDVWRQASRNIEPVLRKYEVQLRQLSSRVLPALGSFAGTVVQFLLSVAVMAVMLAHAGKAKETVLRFGSRFAGKQGAGLVELAIGTIRSVATGVLGVAFVQSVLAAIGMVIVGVPGAGVWTLLVLVLAIVQLPPILVLLPVALWFFGNTESQLAAWIFLVYCVLVSVSDMALKPMLMGRGLDIPMIVVLLGAIGGMLMSGIIGLFVGAVVLALTYTLFMAWVNRGEPDRISESEPA